MKPFLKVLLTAAFCLSVFYLLIRYTAPLQIKEQIYTRFDSEIGWISRPHFKNGNFYGHGKKLTTNSQGFRGEKTYTQQTPEGKTRIICSGDSYTLGYGVADEETWCSKLEALLPNTETVNMGQGGYGIDQAYLWYLRAGLRLNHQIHLFAFISDDFYRMRRDNLMEIYPKPILEIKNGIPIPVNTPLEKPFFTRSRVTFKRVLKKLYLLKELSPAPAPGENTPLSKNAGISALFFSIASQLQKKADSQRARLVLIYLPDPADLFEKTTGEFREKLARECAQRKLHFLDLTPVFKTASREEMASFFDRETGHYSIKGNQRAAEGIRDFLAPYLKAPHREV